MDLKSFFILTFFCFICIFSSSDSSQVRYTPDWPSLDSRPLPEAKKYQKAVFHNV